MNGWIVIPNWEKFQHYHDRSPVWIKLYTRLVDDYDWQQLSLSDRGALVTAWVAYAASDGALNAARMHQLCGDHANAYGNLDKTLKRLNDAGFIQIVASKPLALARSREKRREEKKEEPASKTEKPKTEKRVPFSAPPPPGRVNMPPSDQTAYVRALVRNGVITDVFELAEYSLPDQVRDELADQIRNGHP